MKAPVSPDLVGVPESASEAEFVCGIQNYLIEKVSEHELSSLTALERTVWYANRCEFKILNGGFLDPIINDGSDATDLLAALAAIGATNAERLLRAANDLVQAVPAGTVSTLGELIDAAGEGALDELEREFEALGGADEITEHLWDFIIQNRSRFAGD